MAYKVKILGSGKHLHLSKKDFDILFGEGNDLVLKRQMGAGQFVAEQKVKITGPKRSYENITIIGPYRRETQVELSKTDLLALGIRADMRMSGDLEGTPGIKITGPCGEVELDHGVMLAQRHIHMAAEHAAEAGVEDGEIVLVKAGGERELIFSEVKIKVGDKDKEVVMHMDYDEMNAAGLNSPDDGYIYKKELLKYFE